MLGLRFLDSHTGSFRWRAPPGSPILGQETRIIINSASVKQPQQIFYFECQREFLRGLFVQCEAEAAVVVLLNFGVLRLTWDLRRIVCGFRSVCWGSVSLSAHETLRQ